MMTAWKFIQFSWPWILSVRADINFRQMRRRNWNPRGERGRRNDRTKERDLRNLSLQETKTRFIYPGILLYFPIAMNYDREKKGENIYIYIYIFERSLKILFDKISRFLFVRKSNDDRITSINNVHVHCSFWKRRNTDREKERLKRL